MPNGAVLKPRLSKVILSLSFFAMSVAKNDTPSLIREAMLNWYDRHARVLPWRARPFEKPDPYHVWLSEVMLQQTTVGAVKSYFEKFVTLWPSVHDLADAAQETVMKEWAGLGYYSRARILHKCARVVAEKYDGVFPSDIKTLKLLPGIGDYTAAAIASIAFDRPAIVIDGNIERVISRLYIIDTPLPDSKRIIRNYAEHLFVGENQNRPSCFAQSLMDLGATICTPRSPKCMICPINQYCKAYKTADPSIYPFKKPKKKIPEKHAIAIIYIHNDKIGIETRPEKGMLGGMIGFPTTEWVEVDVPLTGEYKESLKIRHVFTHFALTLYPLFLSDETDMMIGKDEMDTAGLPTLFKKLWNMIKSEI